MDEARTVERGSVGPCLPSPSAQERAIRHRDGPLLLIGEAGTGKTEVLARRFASLAADGTAPERVLLLASTRATAQRLRERVEALLDRP